MANIFDARMGSVMADVLSGNRGRLTGENQGAQMGLYMDKLKDLLPHSGQGPSSEGQQMSKLQLIQHVIDYIGDLQDVLSESDSDSESDSRPESLIAFNNDYTQQHQYSGYNSQGYHGYSDISHNHFTSQSSYGNYSNNIIESDQIYDSDPYNKYHSLQYSQTNYHSETGTHTDLNLCNMLDSSCNISYGYSSGYSSDGSNNSM